MARRRRKLYEVPGRVILSRPLAGSLLEDITLKEKDMADPVTAGAGTAVAAAVSHALSFIINMSVSKKIAKVGKIDEFEYEEVGVVKLPLPLLSDFGVEAKFKRDEKDPTRDAVGEDGLPIYEDDKMDWLFSAAVAATKAQLRNRLISGTAEFKEGKRASETMEELIAEGGRGVGNAEALKLRHEIRKSFAAFVGTLGKSQQTQAVLVGLFSNKEALALQDDINKGKFKAYLGQYADTLEEKDLERYAKFLGSVEEACAPGTPSDF